MIRIPYAERPPHESFGCWIFLFLALLLSVAQARHTHTDSFPTYDEYDMNILDPNTVFGSPYGGFSRATSSRLAALPLYLPPVTNDRPIDNPLYMKVWDALGRLYACRVYHEDELEPDSLEESMFDAPRLRVAGKIYQKKHHSENAKLGSSFPIKSLEMGEGQVIKIQKFTMTADGKIEHSELITTGSGGRKQISEKVTEALAALDIDNRLSQLEGLCGHIHLGWWSYEWCYMSHVSQFHLQADPESETKVKITDPTKLGTYDRRTIETDLSEHPVNPLAEDLPERARVVEIHTAGDICPETGQPRTSKVQLLCCSSDVMTGRKGRMLRLKDNEITEHEYFYASIHGVFEDSDHICNYLVTVCTPILCDEETHDGDEDEEDDDIAASGDSLNAAVKTAIKNQLASGRKENESVREILERTLGEHCLRASTGGWWTYEFCHEGSIRQFHETMGSQKSQNGATYTSKVVESEHMLGKYEKKEADSYPNEDEWKHIVNATNKEKRGGKGAYFEMEYTGGDICDHSDVTDAAIIAGGAGSGGVARACSVRYFCGDVFFVSVSEDSTCHYIVEVTVPDLCDHALFKAPAMKQQVMKCLPVEEDVAEYPT